MSGITLKASVDNTASVTVQTTGGWTEVTFQLDSSAGGTNKIGFDSGANFEAQPGSVYKVTVPPATAIVVTSTNATPVGWSFILQELTYIQVMAEMLFEMKEATKLIAETLAALSQQPEVLDNYSRRKEVASSMSELRRVLDGEGKDVRVLPSTHVFRRGR